LGGGGGGGGGGEELAALQARLKYLQEVEATKQRIQELEGGGGGGGGAPSNAGVWAAFPNAEVFTATTTTNTLHGQTSAAAQANNDAAITDRIYRNGTVSARYYAVHQTNSKSILLFVVD